MGRPGSKRSKTGRWEGLGASDQKLDGGKAWEQAIKNWMVGRPGSKRSKTGRWEGLGASDQKLDCGKAWEQAIKNWTVGRPGSKANKAYHLAWDGKFSQTYG